MPAAISAPKASSIRTSVTGQAEASRRRTRSSPTRSSIALVDRQVAGLADLQVRVVAPGRRSVTASSGAASSWSLPRAGSAIEQRRLVGVPLRLRHRVDPVDGSSAPARTSAAAASAAVLRRGRPSPRGGDQDVLGVGGVEAGLRRPSRRPGRTRRAGSRRRSSRWVGMATARPTATTTKTEPGEDRAPRVGGAPAGGPERDAGTGGCGRTWPCSFGRDRVGLRGSSLVSAAGSVRGARTPTRGGPSTTVRDARRSVRMDGMTTHRSPAPSRLRLTAYAAAQLLLCGARRSWCFVLVVVGGALALIVVGRHPAAARGCPQRAGGSPTGTGAMAGRVLGTPIPTGLPRPTPPGGSASGSCGWARDPMTWRDLALAAGRPRTVGFALSLLVDAAASCWS